MTDTATVEATVLEVRRVGKGRLTAFASVELTLDGVSFVVHGIQVLRMKHPGTGEEASGVALPCYRAPDGTWRPAIDLPPELREPIGDAVLERCCALGITRRVAKGKEGLFGAGDRGPWRTP
jgi:stage V sporulation protein G